MSWLVSHQRAVPRTGVLVVCGFNSRRDGVFDDWCVPRRLGDEAVAEVHRPRAVEA